MSSIQARFFRKLQSNALQFLDPIEERNTFNSRTKNKVSSRKLAKELKDADNCDYPNWDKFSEYKFNLRNHCFSRLARNYSVKSLDSKVLAEHFVYSGLHTRFIRATLGRGLTVVKAYSTLGIVAALRTQQNTRSDLSIVEYLKQDIARAKKRGFDLPPFPVHLPLLLHTEPDRKLVLETLTDGFNLSPHADDDQLMTAMMTYHLDHCDPPKDVYADFFSIGEETFFPTWIFFCCAIGEINAGDLQPFVDLVKSLDFKHDRISLAADEALKTAGF